MMSSQKTTFTGLGLAVLSLSTLLVGLGLATGHFYTKCETALKESIRWKHKAYLELERRKGKEFLLDSTNQLLQIRSIDLNECLEVNRTLRQSVDSLRQDNSNLKGRLARVVRTNEALWRKGKTCAKDNAQLKSLIVGHTRSFTSGVSRPTVKIGGIRMIATPFAENDDPALAWPNQPQAGFTAGVLLAVLLAAFALSGIAAKVFKYRYRRRLRKGALRVRK